MLLLVLLAHTSHLLRRQALVGKTLTLIVVLLLYNPRLDRSCSSGSLSHASHQRIGTGWRFELVSELSLSVLLVSAHVILTINKAYSCLFIAKLGSDKRN